MQEGGCDIIQERIEQYKKNFGAVEYEKYDPPCDCANKCPHCGRRYPSYIPQPTYPPQPYWERHYWVNVSNC